MVSFIINFIYWYSSDVITEYNNTLLEMLANYNCTVGLLQEAFNVITRYELPVDREDLEQVWFMTSSNY